MEGTQCTIRRRARSTWLLLVVVLTLLAAACGADVDDSESSTDSADDGDISLAAGTLGDPNLTPIVDELADGFGSLGTAQRQAIAGVADGDSVCAGRAGERARTTVSEIEVEIVALVDGCLQFRYDVAGFRTLVDDIRRLRRVDDVVAVSPLLLEYRLDQIDSRQLDGQQIEAAWSISTIDGGELFDGPDAPTGQDVVVAVIDSGIDTTRFGLGDANVRRVPDTGEGDYTATGHGTVAAAIIATRIEPSPRALAPAVQLLDVPADLCDEDTCGCDPCAEMTPAEAIRWATDNGADIVSMSFGYRPAKKPAWWQQLLDAGKIDSATTTIEVALAYASANGVAMTAAAGNCADNESSRCEGQDQFEIPAGHESVIGVGALEPQTDGAIGRAWYSTRQSYVELAAPGNLTIVGPDDAAIDKTGTSFANPFVTAALAVLIGADGPLHDQPDRARIARDLLAEGATDLDPEGRDAASGHGMLKIDQALALATEFAFNNPVVDS